MTDGLRIAHLGIAPQWAILRWAILRVINIITNKSDIRKLLARHLVMTINERQKKTVQCAL